MFSSNKGDIIFVGGAPRSGTTVTHALLCTSDKTNSNIPEISFMRPLVESFTLGLRMWENHTKTFFKDGDDFKKHCRAHVEMALNHISEVVGSPEVLTVKDPLLTPYFFQLHRLLPDRAKFVTVIRNPYDVVRSRQEVFETGGVEFSDKVALDVAKGYNTHYAHLKNERLRETLYCLRYEDLNKQETIDQLRAFTGCFDISLDKVWAGRKPTEASPSGNPWHSPKYNGPVDLSNRLSPISGNIRAIVNDVCGDLMDRFNYERVPA